MSLRIQHMMMKLQLYDFKLVYTQGKYIVLADALSRAPNQWCWNTRQHSDSFASCIWCDVGANCTGNCRGPHAAESGPPYPQWMVKRKLPTVLSCILWVWQMALCWDRTGSWYFSPCARTCFGMFMRDIWALRNVKGGPEKQFIGQVLIWTLRTWKCDTSQTSLQTNKRANADYRTTNCTMAKGGTDLFHLNGKDYVLVIDYYSNYPCPAPQYIINVWWCTHTHERLLHQTWNHTMCGEWQRTPV